MRQLPVIDLFAGPGGLGEGFSAYESEEGLSTFRIALSVEKEIYAHQTLKLRSFLRAFGSNLPEDYYQMLRNVNEPLEYRLKGLYNSHPDEASVAATEALCIELGRNSSAVVHKRIEQALGKAKTWVLIGGPPCQAYSLVGRSRNKGNPDYLPENDSRQYLYVEYLQVIAEHRPAVFVMENVKGLLSARVKEKKILERIIDDLQDPHMALKREARRLNTRLKRSSAEQYDIYSLVSDDLSDFNDFIVPMEHHGVPQARHRLILLGVRRDLVSRRKPALLDIKEQIPASQVLDDLPKLRAGLSKQTDSDKHWKQHLKSVAEARWLRDKESGSNKHVNTQIRTTIKGVRVPEYGRGSEFIATQAKPAYNPEWYYDPKLEGVCNHSARSHIADDLYRYLFVSCFGATTGKSPRLADFPSDLLPKHRSVSSALSGSHFADRFKVQLADKPSTTVVSHIAKDGHYYIHYDPAQCRSLTVREAARLQTFPDNYYFCGPRTSQYTQVGNAVPPFLAKQIAEIVWGVLVNAGIDSG